MRACDKAYVRTIRRPLLIGIIPPRWINLERTRGCQSRVRGRLPGRGPGGWLLQGVPFRRVAPAPARTFARRRASATEGWSWTYYGALVCPADPPSASVCCPWSLPWSFAFSFWCVSVMQYLRRRRVRFINNHVPNYRTVCLCE